MLCERVYLYEDSKDVFFDAYCADKYANIHSRKAIIVIPGGGYNDCNLFREGEGVAKSFIAKGYNAFVLSYTVSSTRGCINNDAGYPMPLLELSLAVSKIKENCQKYNIDPERVAVLGFSAGGHLAASLGSLWYKDFIYEQTGIEYGSNKPWVTLLSYPVITMDESFGHKGSAKNVLTGSAFGKDAVELFSIEKQVSDKTVPAFIWHTAADRSVSVKNSLSLAMAMDEHGIPFELHIYPFGDHALVMCDRETCYPAEDFPHFEHASTWKELAFRSLEEIDQ